MNVTVTTSWNDVTYTVMSDRTGEWSAIISTPSAGGPYTVTVSDGRKPEVLDHVLVGEVWICSGQSNMEMKIGDKVTGYEKEMAEAGKYTGIRLFHVENRASPVPMENVEVRYGGWQECSSENIYEFLRSRLFLRAGTEQAAGCSCRAYRDLLVWYLCGIMDKC